MTETVEHLRDFNYYKLDQNTTQVLAEYIWIDGTGERMRSKTKVYNSTNFRSIPIRSPNYLILNGGLMMVHQQIKPILNGLRYTLNQLCMLRTHLEEVPIFWCCVKHIYQIRKHQLDTILGIESVLTLDGLLMRSWRKQKISNLGLE